MTGEPVPQPCTQPGCDGMLVFGRTERDAVTGKGGAKCPIDWPLPPDHKHRDGTPLMVGHKLPNVGVHKDMHGVWIARVLNREEPGLRGNERPGFMHHVFCKNPPPRRPRAAAPRSRPATGQAALDLGVPGAEPAREPGLMSDANLFRNRRRKR